MQFLKGVLIFLLVAGVIIAALYAASMFLKKKKRKELKNAKLSYRRRIHEEMSLELYARNVFSGFSFPRKYSDDDVVLDYISIDGIAVTRGGIAVITVKEYDGLIDNGTGDVWICRGNGGNGDMEFTNPIKETDLRRKAVLSLIKRNKLPDVPVYSIVVFAGKDISFLTEYDNVVTHRQFMELLIQLNSEKVLSLSEMFEIRTMLNEEKRTKKQVAKHKKEIFG